MEPTPEPTPDEAAFRYVHSPGLPETLQQLGGTLVVSTYQAGKLVLFRARQGRISMLLRTFDRAMGVAADADRLAIGTRYQIWFLRNVPDVARQMEPAGTHDACYVPRSSHVTGDIRVHELAWAGDDLWLVNTRFSCLCTVADEASFVPQWKPPFITRLAPEDRCHLNGVAFADGRPRYVTILAETDAPEGWRAHKESGGCLLEVPSGDVVARGLSMPHSPRVHAGRVWVLDSGTGRLLTVDPVRGTLDEVVRLPGFTRGLGFAGGYAFVGLSKIRETATFGGLPISSQQADLKCGVWMVELASGRIEAFLEFDRTVEEVFDVQFLPEIRFPGVVGLQKETILNTFEWDRSKI